MIARILFVIMAAGYTTGVLYFSWTPAAAHTGSETEVIIKQWLFNLLHPPVYAGMMMAWYAVIRPAWEWKWRAALGAVLIATTIGAVGELGQFYVPGRCPDWTDGTLNFVGACLGAWAVYYMTARWRFAKGIMERFK